jgi:gluconate/galactonate dehydratase
MLEEGFRVMPDKDQYEDALAHVNTYSRPSDLRITDMRCVDIVGAPMHCTLLKIFTNQGLVGYGEVRDGGSKTYALMLKDRILGENPCNVDKLFRRLKQFGDHGRQGGGVCGIEVALWDLAGKAYGVPVYQMLGGKFRDSVRLYCDTDARGRVTGEAMGKALQKRMEQGFTFLKMDVGINQLLDQPGALSAPAGYLAEMRQVSKAYWQAKKESADYRTLRNRWYDMQNIAHPFTGIRVTEKGLDILEEYVAQVRAIIGYEIPLAVDHIGHIGVEDCIKLARRLDAYNLAWLEDMLPWQYTDQYVRLSRSCTTPLCTGEDIYLKENFRPLLEARGVSIIHPDILTSGGIYENKKIGDMAQEYGVAMAIHMAESPVACLAAVHSAAATENLLALEFHSVDIAWWQDMVEGLQEPLVQNGYIKVPDAPGLGIEALNDQVLMEHIHPDIPGLWEETSHWDHEWSHDRLWS